MTARKTTKSAEAANGHRVAEGVAITSKRGMLRAGASITAADLSGGQKALDALIKQSKVIKP